MVTKWSPSGCPRWGEGERGFYSRNREGIHSEKSKAASWLNRNQTYGKLTFFRFMQSASASKNVATSIRTVPGIASTWLEAPYPLI